MDFVLKVYQSKATAYFPPPAGGYDSPAQAAMEGGAKDRRDYPLHTAEEVLMGKAPFASAAMDPAAVKLMQQIKKILDPQNIMNPGKIWEEETSS